MADPFVQKLTRLISERLAVPVTVRQDADSIILPVGEANLQGDLNAFRAMRAEGALMAEIVDQVVSDYKNAVRYSRDMSWKDVEARVFPHVSSTSFKADCVVVEDISPILRTVAIVDGDAILVTLAQKQLKKMGVSSVSVRKAALRNIAALLDQYPGEDTTTPGGVTVRSFSEKFAADLAYAYAKTLPAASAVFINPEAALVSDSTQVRTVMELAFAAAHMAHTANTTLNPCFPPAVHLFANGKLKSLILAEPKAKEGNDQ